MPLLKVGELFVVDLSEMLEAEEQILRELPLMAARATSPALRDTFEEHYRDTQRHVSRLATVFEQLDERPRLSTVPGIRGLIEESRLRQATVNRGELLDLALISSARRIDHYEMACYRVARSYARRLGHGDAARLLQETLAEERRSDHRLFRLTQRQSDTATVQRAAAIANKATVVVGIASEHEVKAGRREPGGRADAALAGGPTSPTSPPAPLVDRGQ